MKKKSNNQFVKTIPQLIELSEQGHNDFALVLGGGMCYSKKTIKYNPKTEKFTITNHIDNSKQRLTEKQLMDDKLTLIGKALSKKSLIAIIT